MVKRQMKKLINWAATIYDENVQLVYAYETTDIVILNNSMHSLI